MKRKSKDDEKLQWMTECRLALGEMRSARNSFDSALEPELVEACIYRYNAACQRYSFALKMVRVHSEDEGAAVIG